MTVYKPLINPTQKVSVKTATQEVSKPVKSSESEPAPRKLGTKTDYVPPWYKGERGAYESAKKAMAGINNLPKMKR